MKQLILTTLSLVATICTQAQPLITMDSLQDGIHFEQGLHWKQVVARAKLEKKYIFVDCYTTWCGPCKKMEQDIYPLPKVGDYFNSHFISVKAQMDTSKSDNETIKALYPDAHVIETRYKVYMYPSFLFFNSDGNLLSRTVGAMGGDDLLRFAADARDPQKDYYMLLEQYKKGRRDSKEMSFLARTAMSLLEDTAQSDALARDYMLALKGSDWFAKENIEFMREFTHSSKDRGFDFFYRNADSIDKVMKDQSYSKGMIQNILYKEIVMPEFVTCRKEKTTPDWERMDSMIARKYDQYYANRTITGARADWGGRQKNWPEHSKYFVLYVEKFVPMSDSGGPLEALYFNNSAWDIFEHSTDTSELNTALKWSLHAFTIEPSPGWMDTYANVLYKLKRTDAALKWEEVATKLAHGDKALESNYELMKAGKPTWKVQ